MTRQLEFMFLALIALFLLNCNGEPSTQQETEEPLEIESTEQDNTEVEIVKEPMLLASDRAFYGIKVQDQISGHADKLTKGTTENGEGIFEIYELKNAEGELLAEIYPDPMNEELVGDIVILNPNIITDEGVKIGTTFEELKGRFDTYEVHGSEIESRVHFYQGNHAYRLDHGSPHYDLDESEIPADSEVVSITIMRTSDI